MMYMQNMRTRKRANISDDHISHTQSKFKYCHSCHNNQRKI